MDNKLAFIGYSGHSFVCIEIALNTNLILSGYYDIVSKEYNPYNLNYLGEEKLINSEQELFISIADNNIRKNIYKSLPRNYFNTILIDRNAVVSKTVKINIQSLICAGAIINAQTHIGLGCIINTGTILEHECRIGDFVHVAPGAVLCGGVNVGGGSFIGANSVVKQGVKIGENVIVGAGSVIINDISDNVIVAGNPSKKIRIK